MSTAKIEMKLRPDNTPDKEGGIITVDLEKRKMSWPEKYVVAVEGDNNSQVLTFEFPKNFDGKDLSTVSIDVFYYTDWTDDKGNHSRGSVNLWTPKTEISEQKGELTAVGEDFYRTTWLLDYHQTARAGEVWFLLKFYTGNGIIDVDETDEDKPLKDDEWILKTQSSSFVVAKDNIGGGSSSIIIDDNNSIQWDVIVNTIN